MQLPESLPMNALRDTLATLLRDHGAEYGQVCTGHCRTPEPVEIIPALLTGVEQLLRGEREGDRPYSWRRGECSAHAFDGNPDHCIVYNQNKL